MKRIQYKKHRNFNTEKEAVDFCDQAKATGFKVCYWQKFVSGRYFWNVCVFVRTESKNSDAAEALNKFMPERKPTRDTGINWSEVDWTQKNAFLCKKYKVSETTVYKKRQAFHN